MPQNVKVRSLHKETLQVGLNHKVELKYKVIYRLKNLHMKGMELQSQYDSHKIFFWNMSHYWTDFTSCMQYQTIL